MNNDQMLDASWLAAWLGVGAAGNGESVRDDLLARYNEPARHYHTVTHLVDCLASFEGAVGLAQRPAEVAIALWFHDAVYDPVRHDNEERSAALAASTLSTAGVDADVVARIVVLILATRHAAAPETPDACLLVDIDLAILGASRERFATYETQVRKEYAHVPEAVFWDKRAVILTRLLDRPTLYNTAHFRAMYEQRARDNLAWSLAEARKLHVVPKGWPEKEGYVLGGIVTGTDDVRMAPVDRSSVLLVRSWNWRGPALADYGVYVRPEAMKDGFWQQLAQAFAGPSDGT